MDLGRPGMDGVQQHMTNTASTPVEVMERRWPVRVEAMAIRREGGGAGRHPGGAGVLKRVRFLAPLRIASLMTRHADAPLGVERGQPGPCGALRLIAKDGSPRVLPPRGAHDVEAGDVLEILTPGGGGWRRPSRLRSP